MKIIEAKCPTCHSTVQFIYLAVDELSVHRENKQLKSKNAKLSKKADLAIRELANANEHIDILNKLIEEAKSDRNALQSRIDDLIADHPI